MNIAGARNLPQRAFRSALIAIVGCAALLGGTTAAHAAPAPSCWVQGAYAGFAGSGSWYSWFGHKVVCNVPVTVTTKLERNGVDVAYETSGSNTYSGGWVNTYSLNWPLFCGSTYRVKVYATAIGGSANGVTSFVMPSRAFC